MGLLTNPKKIALSPSERIVAVTPEFACGPGWSNAVAWVHIVDYATNAYRCESIQPDERTPELNTLFAIGEKVSTSLIDSIPTKRREAKAT